MLVEVGDVVKKGQALFENNKAAGVIYTAPASGVVTEINRGERRVLQSVVIECHEEEDAQEITFSTAEQIGELNRESVQQNLVASGLWTSLRTRPFSHVPQLNDTPAAIFVTAMDSNPLSAEPRVIIAEQQQAFAQGIQALTHLSEGKVYLCQDAQESLPGADLDGVEVRRFAGVHPAGIVGTHIHFTLPVSIERQVWHIGYQDVIAIGQLFMTGQLFTERVISLAGPFVSQPRLLRTCLGAKLSDVVYGELKPGFPRVVSGSVLSGHKATGAHDYLGRFHVQVTALEEDAEHQLLPWVQPGSDKFSVIRSITSGFKRSKKLFNFTTNTRGAARSILAFGQLDRVMPLDILPTLLVRDLVVQDTDEAQALGALELDEEDLALCTFVSPGKYDFGKELRTCLDIIEREG
ncbi:Na(+)-translocating NADH-quinone reductase subunit A [Shewanella gelidii]|uniref:Na(+)-translocating NADH-quinone reductase subunit A n=2 Tax=Shewanella gelidii TaxID=1642821 RepID=A0A917N8I2_9GAMM|nr:Na(+)-translocating NADH-quinone reductase subunit A [Shewanella gelidii]